MPPEHDDPIDREADRRQRPASSIARSQERLELESHALANALRELIREFLAKRDYKRVMVLELLFVKGVPNWKIAEQLGVNEQQVANYRFAAVKKLTAAVEAAGAAGGRVPGVGVMFRLGLWILGPIGPGVKPQAPIGAPLQGAKDEPAPRVRSWLRSCTLKACPGSSMGFNPRISHRSPRPRHEPRRHRSRA